MNVCLAKKINRSTAALALIVAGAGLSGCVGAFNPETDATSPVAPRVQALVDANRTYPRWEDFPKAETPPEATVVAARVNTLGAAAGTLQGQVAGIDWQNTDAATLEQEVAGRLDASKMAPATAQTAAELEALAARLRARGAAPPPIPRQ